MADVVENSSLLSFFRDLVRRAIVKHKISLTEDSEFYIVNLLSELKKTDKAFDCVGGQPEDTPLALLLERAVHGDTATRVRTLKFLGDNALFVAGIFPERATRRFKTLDYYIRMGGGAYLTLASSMPGQRGFSEVFEEMGIKFRHLVDVVNDVGKAGRNLTDINLLECYERFLATGDQRLRDVLVQEGILPVAKHPGSSNC
ncbi:MAG: hypothetical protein COV45_04660 [Deltaproteobacteria bacterium CG11_big_fil_rev_8_21_14_0_20_47_16]|nr:MAG: hypothetical protein COV45_04660 [Deltaproteobacteria bacterium CG11_big_fil_rev_8_21_14_0_20_47_16]